MSTSHAVLVTGGAGFVGGHVVRMLLLRGRTVVVYDVAPELPSWIVPDSHDGEVTHVRADLRDVEVMREVILEHGVADVVHLAAAVAQGLRDSRDAGIFGGTSELVADEHAPEVLEVNALALWRMCEMLVGLEEPCRLLAAGSRAVYRTPDDPERVLDECSPIEPRGFYGASKSAGDEGLRLFRARKALNATCLRISGAYGPGQRHHQPLSLMLDHAMEGDPLRVPEGSEVSYELTYVKDVAAAIGLVLSRGTTRHWVYNLGSGTQYSLVAMAAAVRDLVPGARIDVGEGYPASHTPRGFIGCQRLRGEFGFEPRWGLVEGTAEFLRWKREERYGAEVPSSALRDQHGHVDTRER